MRNPHARHRSILAACLMGIVLSSSAGCGPNDVPAVKGNNGHTGNEPAKTPRADVGPAEDRNVKPQEHPADKRPVPEQRQAVSAIESYGGSVTLDDQNRVMIVDLTGSPVPDDGLANLHGLTSLRFLNLEGTAITDDGLAHLEDLTRLRTLRLSRTSISDAGLKHLAGLENLVELYLYNTAITDAGLTHLAGLQRLRKVRAKSTNVTIAGIEALSKALPGCSVK